MSRFITAANAVVTITIPGLFSSPQQLQGFAAQNVYDISDQDLVETAMGVDGKLAAGVIFAAVDQTFVLMANSESCDLFEQWALTQRQQVTPFSANGRTTLPAVNKSYISTNGYLIRWPPLPGAGRTLTERRFVVRWESIQSTPN